MEDGTGEEREGFGKVQGVLFTVAGALKDFSKFIVRFS